MRINREIRAAKVRVTTEDGEHLGILSLMDALSRAEAAGLDLVEISSSTDVPVCKIIDYGKLRYQQTKKEKEGKKAQHQVKVKEVKLKPNTDDHDLQTKLRHAREFIEKGNKVRVTCVFRGREMAHPELGMNKIKLVCSTLADIASPEAPPKMMGRNLSVVITPGAKKKSPPTTSNLTST